MPTLSYQMIFPALSLASALAAGPAMASEPAPDEILRRVDSYRMPLRSFQASLRVTPVKDGKEQEAGTYIIRGAGRNQVLVEATSSDQYGQKFLTTDGGLFFYAPRTKRAIRLTPLQSLRGLASIGDIARISFENDYQASATDVPPQSCPDADCIALQLTSKNEVATYTRIVLVLSKRQYRPLSAMLYVASGKLLKIARFDAAQGGLPPTTRYVDPQDPKEETRVVFEKVAAATFPDSTFNPRALER
ncbi:outer membrane lipoprotein-sorting protein [Oxalobacteraceae bacterium GrIS 1.11]